MKDKFIEELRNLDRPLQEAGITLPLFDIDILYREIAEELKEAGICRYAKLEDTSFLSKKDHFTVNIAVSQCKKVIISRIEDRLVN